MQQRPLATTPATRFERALATSPAARLESALPLLLLALLFLLLMAPALNPEVQLFYRDTGRLYYPVKKFVAETLRSGRLPLWDPWTEAGTSLLAQTTPGLFHPFTLLYLLLPFDLAFKLNHLLALPLAGFSAYLLARRLGASPWGAAAAGATYGGCGFLVSMAASNLPYALGPAAVPLALERFLAFEERPSPLRLFLASGALALAALAGEPQSMLIAGVIGSALVVVRAFARGAATPATARLRAAVRSGLLAGVWGLAALGLCAPAALPAAARLAESTRMGGVSAAERGMFVVVPARFLGLLVPRAFDDPTEVFNRGAAELRANPYREYFSLETVAAFSDSIVLGAPALLLALFGCFSGRKGRFLFAGALLFLFASAGNTLGVQDALMAVVPGFRYFRYAEKFAAPVSLLVALAAALGLDFALAGSRRAALALVACAGALGVTGFGLALALLPGPLHERASSFLIAAGNTHDPLAAARFLLSLRAGLLMLAGLSGALALVAALRAFSRVREVSGLGALCCMAAVLACNTDTLLTAPVDLLHGPFALGEYLLKRAGPSEGRWRLLTNTEASAVPLTRELGERLAGQEGVSQSLIPQFEALGRIEGASSYFSAPDGLYAKAIEAAPYPLALALGVRFVLLMPWSTTAAAARARGFEHLPRGYWLLELPQQPRAFLASRARSLADAELLAALSAPAFSPRTEALLREQDAALAQGLTAGANGLSGFARWSRHGPDRMSVAVDSKARALLVVGEHFDPGWRAWVDGAPAPVARVDGAAMGVPIAAGRHEVQLTFRPVGLVPGMLFLAATLAALLAWNPVRRTVSVRK